MDLSTTPRRAAEGVGDLQKTRAAKSVFSIRSLVDVEETEQDEERPQSKFSDSPLEFSITRVRLKRFTISVNSRFKTVFEAIFLHLS